MAFALIASCATPHPWSSMLHQDSPSILDSKVSLFNLIILFLGFQVDRIAWTHPRWVLSLTRVSRLRFHPSTSTPGSNNPTGMSQKVSAWLHSTVSRTKHVWYSEHGTYYQFEFILERAMSATHVAVILCTGTSPAYEEESMKTDYPDARNGYGMS